MASALDADGSVAITNPRGQRFLETGLTVQALERAWVGTVLMTEGKDNENGNAPPLLIVVPEIVSAVSTGTNGVEVTFPKVDRILVLRQPDAVWYQEKPPIHDRHGVAHLHDFYGFDQQDCVGYQGALRLAPSWDQNRPARNRSRQVARHLCASRGTMVVCSASCSRTGALPVDRAAAFAAAGHSLRSTRSLAHPQRSVSLS